MIKYLTKKKKKKQFIVINRININKFLFAIIGESKSNTSRFIYIYYFAYAH